MTWLPSSGSPRMPCPIRNLIDYPLAWLPLCLRILVGSPARLRRMYSRILRGLSILSATALNKSAFRNAKRAQARIQRDDRESCAGQHRGSFSKHGAEKRIPS